MAIHIRGSEEHRKEGVHPITVAGEAEDDTGIDFGVLKLGSGQQWMIRTTQETAVVLFSGSIKLSVNDSLPIFAKRSSLFDEQPFCLHVPLNTKVTLLACEAAELAITGTENPLTFPVQIILPEKMVSEHRGADWVDQSCYRLVRTILDRSNTPHECQLVVGEVVNFPGRWSSYPPHHHPHPEIYHYRFTDDRGYGFCQLGEEVYRVRSHDTVKILNNVDHPQCAAPGYGMYYLWIIRHLPSLPYTSPEFTEEHSWVMQHAESPWNCLEMRR